jgi:hypothetical protein
MRRSSKRKSSRRRTSKKSSEIFYTGVIPYAIHNGVKYYLIGKEHTHIGWEGSGKWSDFGGDPENEGPLNGAAREFYEETMGFFGNLTDIRKKLKGEKRVSVPGGYTYLMKIKYDPHIPALFERVHRYFLQCARIHKYKKGNMTIPSCPEGLFEKTDIKWVTESELKHAVRTRSKLFRTKFLRSLEEIL